MKSYKNRSFLKDSALLILLAFLLPSNSYAEKKSFEFCTKLSQSINKEYPMRINKYAVVETSFCSNRKGIPSINYIYETEFVALMPGEIERTRNKYCSETRFHILLEAFKSIILHYYDSSGRKYEEIEISESHCR